MFAEDMSVFFDVAGFAQSATWNGQTANVLFDVPTDDVLGGQAIANQYIVTIPVATFSGIARNAVITIAGVDYSVREVRLIDDGALKTLTLSKL